MGSHTGKAGLVTYHTQYAPVLRHGIFISPHEEKHFRPALAGGKCFLSPRIHAIFRGGHIFIFLFRFCSAIISAAKSALCGRAFGSHPRGRGFEFLQVHQNENRPKGRFSFCRGPAGVEVYPPLRGNPFRSTKNKPPARVALFLLRPANALPHCASCCALPRAVVYCT